MVTDGELLHAIFDSLQPHELVEIQIVSADKSQSRSEYFTSIAAALAFVEAEDALQQNHIFFGAAPRTAQTQSKDAIERVTTLWADVDAKHFKTNEPDGSIDEAFNAAMRVAVPASFVVFTGGGYHIYWLLREAVTPVVAEEAMKSIKKAIGGDTVWNCNRSMRVPYTHNVKYTPPVQSRVVLSRPDLRYNASDVVAGTKLSSTTLDRLLTGDSTGFASRSERDWSIVRELMRAGMSEECIRVVYSEQPAGDKFRDAADGEKYLSLTLRNAAKTTVTTTTSNASGIVERDGVLFVETTKGGLKQVSTFQMNPTRLLEGDAEDVVLVDISSEGYDWRDVALPKHAFSKGSSLLKFLTIAAWQWLGNDDHTRRLLIYLMTLMALETSSLVLWR